MTSLPTGISPPSEKNPRLLLLYGIQLSGKTLFLTKLPEPYLLIDIDGHAGFYSCCRTGKIKSYMEFIELLLSIEKAGKPYKYVAVDSITELVGLCIEHTTAIYNRTKSAKEPEVADIRDVPFKGYETLYTAFLKLETMLERVAPYIIFIGHVKDKWDGETAKMLDGEARKGVTKNILEEPTDKILDLPGKLANTFLGRMHAVGYFRKGATNPDGTFNNQIIFEGTADRYGSRAEHLRGKTIPADWNLIYV